jgi:hypothetical protein
MPLVPLVRVVALPAIRPLPFRKVVWDDPAEEAFVVAEPATRPEASRYVVLVVPLALVW